ncbi:hypothetical protein G7076_00865 [Sphingomonas sp. HDW15A]|uniref:hypothetical protein n=1 Tax=Sphingomonas sp. HDW15A TaxID=2714942 RepID=UPI00140CC493|nr:hypothetical protein [Sphingomonas sp. HDW15A]QIK95232.1 hypothetical protein G7076_00865 [Sphingomonas sp. HDW15A]
MSGEDIFVGIVALLGALALAWRLFGALRTGEVALYRNRISRNEAGPAKFNALIGLNALALVALLAIAADLLLGLGLRG